MESVRYYTPAELAAYLQKSVYTLKTWRARQTGPPYLKVGGSVRYPKLEVEAWLMLQRSDVAKSA